MKKTVPGVESRLSRAIDREGRDEGEVGDESEVGVGDEGQDEGWRCHLGRTDTICNLQSSLDTAVPYAYA